MATLTTIIGFVEVLHFVCNKMIGLRFYLLFTHKLLRNYRQIREDCTLRVSLHCYHALPCALLLLECFSFHAHDLNDWKTAASAFQHLLLEISFLKTFMMTRCRCRDLRVCWWHIYSVLDPGLFERRAPLCLLLHFVA